MTTGSEGTGLHGRGLDAFPDSVSSSTNDDIFPGFELVDPSQTEPSDTGPFAYRRSIPLAGGGTRGQVVVQNAQGIETPMAVNTSAFSVFHPSIAVSGGHETIVYDVRTVDSSGQIGQADIGFCVIFVHNGSPCGLGQGGLPPLVDSSRDESRPAFTPDGRYIGFIRDEANGHERVFVFDTEAQTLIDPDGTDLGLVATIDTGNLGLYQKFVLKATNIPDLGTVTVLNVKPVPIGLLVQRVVGHHRLLGRRVVKLKTVGRIPLGKFRRGSHKIHFRPRVHGHRLRPGRYQFTVRALTRRGKVRDLGEPRILRVR